MEVTKKFKQVPSIKKTILSPVALALAATFALVSCNSIDDDLSDCGKDYRMDYELRLITNISTEIETVLNTDADQPVADALRQHLKNIFTDFAHDVDLSFYDTQGDSMRLHHEQHIMDANEESYTIYLPVQEYMHLALANIADAHSVTYNGDIRCPTARLSHAITADTIDSQNTGLFTARLPMHILEGQDQDFYVRLYMVNSAAALVVDTTNCEFRRMWTVTTDMADNFLLRDSIYSFHTNPIIRTNDVVASAGTQACFCSVNFPSRDLPVSRTRATSADSDPSQGSCWQMRLYVALTDGTITENRIYVYEPLKAGNLKIIKVKTDAYGRVESTDQEVGVGVSLDWKGGLDFNR